MLILGLAMALAAGVSDVYLHRGIETSASPPYVIQPSGKGLATNADLTRFPSSQMPAIAQTLSESGFQYLRQTFRWDAIEPESSSYQWSTYDEIVRVLSEAGVEIVATISDTPDWARAPGAEGFADAPPADPEALTRFLEAFLARYGQYIRFVQVGDRPNLAANWGGQQATGVDYAALLAPAFNAIRSASPEARVLLAELDPYGNTGRLGDDLTFLEDIYRANGEAYFDVVTARIDGGEASPYDRRTGRSRLNLSRAIMFRELLQEYGDDQKPVWLSRYGWNSDRLSSRELHGEYLVAAVDRARQEWPWAGPLFQWQLLPLDSEGDASYALLNPDGTATASFLALRELANRGIDEVAPTGFVPMTAEAVEFAGVWADQHLTGSVFNTTGEIGASTTIRFEGTGLTVYLRRSPDAGLIRATLDGGPLPAWGEVDGASEIDLSFYQAEDIWVELISDEEDQLHELVLTLADEGQMTIGGAVVSRDPPLLWPVILVLVGGLVLTIAALRELMFRLATHVGWVAPREGIILQPVLPRMPDWQPARRA